MDGDLTHKPTAAPPGPALGLLELKSVARGVVAADALAKRAMVRLVLAHPVSPGKFIILLTGGEEEVAEAMGAGQAAASDTLVDRLYLPKADPQVISALQGSVAVTEAQALGTVETFSVAAAVLAADRAVKAAEVLLVQLRLARGLGGKAFFHLTGELHQVQAGVEAARGIIHDGMLLTTEIIPRPHPDLIALLLEHGAVPPTHG